MSTPFPYDFRHRLFFKTMSKRQNKKTVNSDYSVIAPVS